MMPLWMTTTRPEASRCGCAFSSEGRPCVAQRVCPTPNRPGGGSRAIFAVRLPSLPSLRATRTTPSFPTTAMPAES